MNKKTWCYLLIWFVGASAAFAQGDGFDKEMSAFAEKLAKHIKESGRKKVTILDFTDLQGGSSELGRFLAEELSVNLVERRSGFSIMDRANLKTILAEHKLTVEGLVDPENAKKLGQFSGVDAIILGNLAPLDTEVAVTAKVITTDTAEIVGAARARIPKGKEILHLLTNSLSSKPSTATVIKTESVSDRPVALLKKEANFRKFGDLNVEFDSLRLLGEQLGSYHIKVTLVLRNESSTEGIFVMLRATSATIKGSLISDDDVTFFAYTGDVSGINSGYDVRHDWTEIESGGAIKVSIEYQGGKAPRSGKLFKLEQEVLIATPENLKASQFKTHNLFLDIEEKK